MGNRIQGPAESGIEYEMEVGCSRHIHPSCGVLIPAQA